MALLPVVEARARILAKAKPLPGENVSLADAMGRVLATAVTAKAPSPAAINTRPDPYVRAGRGVLIPSDSRSHSGGTYTGTYYPAANF